VIPDLAHDLETALIQNPAARRTNTPTDVLAAHLVKALELFEETLLERARHPFYAPGNRNGP
jgi:TorA maturation chaperone TorD